MACNSHDFVILHRSHGFGNVIPPFARLTVPTVPGHPAASGARLEDRRSGRKVETGEIAVQIAGGLVVGASRLLLVVEVPDAVSLAVAGDVHAPPAVHQADALVA